MTILLLADHDGKVLSEQTAKALTAAAKIGGDVHVLVAGTNVSTVADAAAKLSGVAKVLVAELWRSRRGCLSVQVLQEFYVVGVRKLTKTASSELRLILNDFALWRVHAPDTSDVLAAADLHQRYQVSFWDAMVLQSATRLACAVVWSEDLNPGQSYQGVRVLNPFATA